VVFLLAAIAGIIVGLAAIMSWVIKGMHLLSRSVSDRRERRAAELVMEAEDAKRHAQQVRFRKTNHRIALHLQNTRSSRAALPFDDGWSSANATGYGAAVRDDMRRRGISPADYARGQR
jgi:hypothetical protein